MESQSPGQVSCGLMTLPARCPTVSYLFPSHLGQFIQVNINEVEFHSIWRLALRMQDFFHQDIEEELDSAEENNTHGSVNYSIPTLCSSLKENSHVCSLATLRNSARLSAVSEEKSNPWNGYKMLHAGSTPSGVSTGLLVLHE